MNDDKAQPTSVKARQSDKRSSTELIDRAIVNIREGYGSLAIQDLEVLRSEVQQRSGDGQAWALEATSWLIKRCKQEINDGTRNRGTTLGSYYNMRHGLIIELIGQLMAQSQSNTDERMDS